MNKYCVFVYGTLRRGSAGSMSTRFPKSKFIAEAKVNGSLYYLGPYPGVLLDNSNLLVIGEVYEVDDDLLEELDEFEASSNYVRKQVEISFGVHRAKCWIYEPNPEFYGLHKLITSGDWIKYSKTKTDSPEDTPPEENRN
ncbi:MAG TPA: gamma-glutamylcyclotransferase [Blastocatellia bacterium]|nr:gamma-glutamylcyclotransferase [Blastocatellia bacterium]